MSQLNGKFAPITGESLALARLFVAESAGITLSVEGGTAPL